MKNISAWQPIEIYEQMKKKPKLCVFRFEPAYHPRSNGLPELFDFTRVRGSRACTHFFELPEFTEEE